jgi:hypothetical protein
VNRYELDQLIDSHRPKNENGDLTRYDSCELSFDGIDLSGIDLNGVEFSSVDLTGVIGLPDAPVVKDLDQKIFDAVQVDDALDMDYWHTCETTHCRAGWAIHLAGGEGYALELRYGSEVAAALIYFASTGRGKIPNWYQSNDDARADIKRCAELPRVDSP